MEESTNEIIQNESPKRSGNWLQRLKDESWEAELLVSAIAIFGTFQLFDVINWGTNMFINILSPSQYLVGYIIIFLGLFAISILASMFVIHFFLRAYWIGLVGLNSVFPDYSIEDSVYSKIYTEKILATLPKLEDSIKKVDQLCSVIFSAAFTFLLIYMYIALIASIYLLIFNLLSSYVSIYILLIPVVVFALILLVQMFMSIFTNTKKNKEKEELQILNFKIVKFTSILLYGPLYKSIMQVSMIFGSNFKKNKSLVFLMLVFLFSGMIVAMSQLTATNIPYLITKDKIDALNATRINPDYYESENNNNTYLLTPEIKSDIIKSEVIKVFIPIYVNEKNRRVTLCDTYVKDESKTMTEQRMDRLQYSSDCFKTYNIIYINNERIDVEFSKYTHPRTNQNGALAYINLSGIKTGMNVITVKKVFGKDDKQEWSIPFYYLANSSENKN